MTRRCDNCEKIIPLGDNHIELRFIGMENMRILFNASQLDFCKLECLVEFWSKYKTKEEN